MGQYSVVGTRMPRVDGIDKVSGSADYIMDIRRPGVLYGKVLRSPYPHARILSIDTSRAEKLPGVKAVITGKDVPQVKFGYRGTSFGADKYILAVDKVRFVGDDVAAVAAVSENIAEDALSLIKVEYEELPAVFDAEEARVPGAPLIHEAERNTLMTISRHFGDVDKGFAESDHVFEDRFVTQAQAHCCMEVHGYLAEFDHSGKLIFYASCQTPQSWRVSFSDIFGIPTSKIRIIDTQIGGAFGSKSTLGSAPICVLLARETGRPVKLINTREEEFVATGHRYPMTMYLKTGVRKDGRLVAWHLRNIQDIGAYTAAAYIVLSNTGSMLSLLYGVPNVKFDGYGVYTNNPWGTGCRGLGGPQVHFAMESQMDIIAERLGMDPVELRLINANRPNTVTASGKRITSCGLRECIEQAAAAAGWKEKKGKHPNRGFGIACFACASGGGLLPPYNANYAESVVKVDERGVVNVLLGEPEVGTGASTVVALIAAEQLGVSLDSVQVAWGDTEMVPLSSWGTGASRVTFVAGNAVKKAADDARRQVFEIASEMLEANPEDLAADNGRVCVKGSPDKGVSLGQAVGAAYKKTGGPITGKGMFAATWSTPQDEKGYGSYAATYAFAAQVVEVEVDKRSGHIEMLNYVAAHDIGFAINPIGVEGQIEGAAVMGTGYAIMEEVERKDGKTVNANLMDYRVPTAMDAPPLRPIMVETIDPDGPFGAKGIAEPGMVPTAAAVANAIYDAVGVRIKDLPLTPMKVRESLRKQEDGR